MDDAKLTSGVITLTIPGHRNTCVHHGRSSHYCLYASIIIVHRTRHAYDLMIML